MYEGSQVIFHHLSGLVIVSSDTRNEDTNLNSVEEAQHSEW